MTKPPSPREVAADLRGRATSQSRSLRELMIIAAQIIDHLMTQLTPRINERGMIEFVVSSGYSAETEQPFVHVQFAGQSAQLSPEQATAHALNILEASEAAKTDALLLTFCREQMDLDFATAVRLTHALRAYRDTRDGTHVQSA